MVDRRRLDPPGPRRSGEEQQGEAVGAPGDGNADAGAAGDQRIEIGREAVDERAIDLQLSLPSLRATRGNPAAGLPPRRAPRNDD